MATEPPARPAPPNIEPTSASATRIRVVIDDLIHLILRSQLTTRTPMPGLFPQGAGLTVTEQAQLGALLQAATRSGYQIRVALVASADLG